MDVAVKAYGILDRIAETPTEERGGFLRDALESGDQRITANNIIPLIDKISSSNPSYKSFIISQIIFASKKWEHLITKSNIMDLISNSNDSARCIDNLFAAPNLRKLITPENALDLVNQSENPVEFIKSLVNYSEMQSVITETNIVPLLKNAIAYINKIK